MRGAGLVAVLAACGRLGFDTVGDAGNGNGDGVLGDRPPITSNIMFVTRGNQNIASFGGLGGADATCNMLATQAQLPGTYVAYLSTTTTNARDRIATARGWTRTDGTPFADTAAEIATGRIFSNPMFEPSGTRANSGAYWVVTGTNGDGTTSQSNTCGDYANASGFVQLGRATATSMSFSQWSTGADCGSGERIYCFGIDRNMIVAAPVPTTTGRRAFLSSPWPSGGGLSGADAHCQMDAASVSPTGTFKALLATSTASAASRFTTAGGPWMRLDGISLAPTAAGLLANNLIEPLNLTVDGQYLGGPSARAWVGASAVDQMGSGSTCNDWISTVPGQSGNLGSPEYADLYWFFQNGQNCNNSARLYCLEP